METKPIEEAEDLETTARVAALRDVVSRFPRGCPPAPELRSTALRAQDLAREVPARAVEVAEGSGEECAAAAWLTGCLWDALGRHEAACAVFARLAGSAAGEERALIQLACARSLAKCGRGSDAWRHLADAAGVATSHRTLAAIDKLISSNAKRERPPARRSCRLALAGSGMLEFWTPALRARCFALGIHAEIYVAPFQQFRQEILSPESGLKAFRPDVVVLAPDWRSLNLPDESAAPEPLVREKIAGLEELWHACRESIGAAVIQHNFEIPESDPYGRLSTSRPGGRGRLLRRINLELWEAEQRHPGLAIFDLEQTSSLYGKQHWSDPVMWHAAKQYPAADALPLLAKRLAGLLRALFGLTAKCLVLDLDNTLWGGIIGEDGLAGIQLGGSPEGEVFVAFQTYLKSLRARGILLAVCSKNNPEDARSVFLEHPETILKMEDFSVFAANWRPKEENLREIASALNLGIDSLVFVDDSHAERLRIRQVLPEVEVLELPEDPARYVETLDRSLAFETLTLTEEDYRRAAVYADNALRRELQTASASVDDFLASLQMQVELRPFDEINLPRIVQLINKTNQFNLTTRRRSQAEVSALMARPDCYTQFMRLRDRFGDNGITGILIAFEEGEALRIDTWLMSCRVLGRSVEEAMIGSVLHYAAERGLRMVQGEYLPTKKNAQVQRIYEQFGFVCVREDADGGIQFQHAGSSAVSVPAFLAVNDTTRPAAQAI